MRTISKYISFALMAFAVVACHTNDIDNPDNPDNPNPPQISDNVTFTASIKQTRVEYTHNGDKLDQRWKKDDVIYGFYGDGDGRKIALLVTDVDDKDGYATLKPLPLIGGDEFVAALKECIKNEEQQLSFGLIYTGKTGSIDTTEKDLYYDDDVIYVDMSRQSTGQIPACMESASYSIDEASNGDTIINFKFENRCAILEIKGITGTKESTDLSEEGPTKLDFINVSNVINAITYSYNNGKPGLGTDGTYKETGVKVSGSIYVDSNGNIVDSNGNSKSVMMAVAPNEKKEDIIVSAETSNDTFVASYNTDLVAGNCYVIRQQDVVAKTEDGFYFTTVKAAFDHAAELSEDNSGNYNTAETNVVTLLAPEIDGLGTPEPGWWNDDDPLNGEYDVALMIDIDYNVTLDLNGCTLYLNYSRDESGNIIVDEWDDPVPSDGVTSGAFYVSSGKSFKIQNSSKGDGECRSCSNCTLVINKGNTIVSSGNVYHTLYSSAVQNYGNLIVEGGTVYSCYGNAILNHNNLKVQEEGEVTSYGSAAISSNGGTVNITGGVISNSATATETIQILSGAECRISGGVVYSTGQVATIACRSTSEDAKNSKLWITWPIITNPDAEEPQYDQAFEEGLHEPLIYSFGSAYQSSPITANYDNMDNTAEVYIQGGYLLAHNQNSHGFFYNDDRSPQGQSEGFDNLKLSQCGQFYANTYHVNTQGNTYNPDCDIDLHSYFSVRIDSGLSYIPGFFEDYFDEEDFEDGFPEETVLYYFEFK